VERVIALSLLIGLAACEPATNQAESVVEPAPIYSAQSIGPVSGGVAALAFAPNASIPWEGRLLIALRSGGMALYNIEGKKGFTTDGPLYSSLAVQAGFSIRQLKTSLVLAAHESGALSTMIVDDARGQIFEVPISGLPKTNVSGVCAINARPDSPTFVILRNNGNFEYWQITDTGDDLLQAKLLKSTQLAVRTKNCASSNGKIFATGAKSGIYAIDGTNKPVIEGGTEQVSTHIVALSPDENTTYLLTSSPENGALQQFDRAMKQTGYLSAVASLSNPPVARPGALAISTWSFGGAGFSAGLLAIADDENNKISLVVRDTLPGFEHDQGG